MQDGSRLEEDGDLLGESLLAGGCVGCNWVGCLGVGEVDRLGVEDVDPNPPPSEEEPLFDGTRDGDERPEIILLLLLVLPDSEEADTFNKFIQRVRSESF